MCVKHLKTTTKHREVKKENRCLEDTNTFTDIHDFYYYLHAEASQILLVLLSELYTCIFTTLTIHVDISQASQI